jgi:hypothetical protein
LSITIEAQHLIHDQGNLQAFNEAHRQTTVLPARVFTKIRMAAGSFRNVGVRKFVSEVPYDQHLDSLPQLHLSDV